MTLPVWGTLDLTLKGVAAYYGYEPSSIDELLDVGFSTDEIEELLYERMIY